MQNKIKKLIIFLLIILVILAIVIVCIIVNLKHNKQNSLTDEYKKSREYFDQVQNDPSIAINEKKPEIIKSEGVYFTISNILEKYDIYLKDNNVDALYNILYKQYIEQNNISKNNILEKLNKSMNYEINQIYALNTINYGIYYVEIYNNKVKEELLINWDTLNDTFSISPISEGEFNKVTQEGTNIDKQRIEAIAKNNYNNVQVYKTDSDSIAKKYFYDFIEKIVNKPEKAYSLLDETYKNNNFTNYNDFLQYVNDNKERLVSLDHNNLKEVTDFSDYIEYEKYYQKAIQNKMKNYVQTTNNRNKNIYI